MTLDPQRQREVATHMKGPRHLYCGSTCYRIEQPSIPTLDGPVTVMWWCIGCMSVVPSHEVSK